MSSSRNQKFQDFVLSSPRSRAELKSRLAMPSSESDIEALRAELEAEKAKVRLLEREVEAYKAGAKSRVAFRDKRGASRTSMSPLISLNDFQLSVLDLDMDVMDVCCVEVIGILLLRHNQGAARAKKPDRGLRSKIDTQRG